jgi:hypothetical protein
VGSRSPQTPGAFRLDEALNQTLCKAGPRLHRASEDTCPVSTTWVKTYLAKGSGQISNTSEVKISLDAHYKELRDDSEINTCHCPQPCLCRLQGQVSKHSMSGSLPMKALGTPPGRSPTAQLLPVPLVAPGSFLLDRGPSLRSI